MHIGNGATSLLLLLLLLSLRALDWPPSRKSLHLPFNSSHPLLGEPVCRHKRTCLYCFVVAQAQGYERQLLRLQASEGLGIFGCELRQVFSNVSFRLKDGSRAVDMGMSLVAGKGAGLRGLWAMNTDIFVKAWRLVAAGGLWQRSAWTVKVDVDTVFLPARLQRLVREVRQPGKCWLENHGDNPRGLYGAIIVLSREAAWAVAQGLDECEDIRRAAMLPPVWDKEEETFRATDRNHTFGEDKFLAICMMRLGVSQEKRFMGKLMAGSRVDVDDCSEDCVAFHAFKTVKSFRRCLERARGR